MASSKQDEYNRLYQLLSSLSTKNQSLLSHGVVPMISLDALLSSTVPTDPIIAQEQPLVQPLVPPLAPPLVQPLVQPLVPPLAPPLVQPLVPPLAPPLVQPSISPKKEIPDLIRKDSYECNACLKQFTVKETYEIHVATSLSCKKWNELSPSEKENNPPKAIHEMADDWLDLAIGVPDRIQCKFCKMTFVNRGNHHKHYKVAAACNRLAFLEFKKVIANLNAT
jgi:hypothetical protein